jgi:glycosyltransferase involved in cell wall biosynthesis
MKVCFVSPTAYGYFNPDSSAPTGGAERQLYLLSKAFGSDVSVSFIVGDYGQPAVESREGTTLRAAYEPEPATGPITQGHQLLSLYRAMRDADADVYVQRGNPRRAAVTYVLTRLLGRNWVFNLANDANITRDVEGLSRPFRRLYSRALSNADGVIAQTPFQRRRLVETFGVEADVVSNGYPSAAAAPPFSARSGFIWVGRFDRTQKRPHLYLDLAERVPDRQFLLIGNNDNDDAYYERIRDRAHQIQNVRFVGQVSPDEIHEYYRTALALVNTSAYEGFPNTFLEAWRQHTPVLSLDVDPGRYVDIPDTGYCDGSLDVLARHTASLEESETEWRTRADPAHRAFEKNLTIETVAAAYESTLRNACAGR